MKKIVFLSLLIFCFFNVTAQQKIRVMSYNLENYPNGKDADFKKIIAAINPDAIIAIEVIQQAGVNQFLTNSLDSTYSAATVKIASTNSAGNDGNDCAFYYKKNTLSLIETKTVPARTRVISSFKVVSKSTRDTLIILGVHPKANDYSSDNVVNAQKRDSAVTSIRKETKSYRANTNYLIGGDFNIFSSEETAFQKLLNQTSPGYFIDMMNAKGNWNGNSAFSALCTYSPVKLDTRLDMILISPSLLEKGGVDYVNDSFKIFGNDNNHFNLSVITGSNAWFTNDPSLGNSIVSASDHLPVYADFSFGVPTKIETEKEIPASSQLFQNYPNPFNPTTEISYLVKTAGYVTLKVYDLMGREIETLVNEFKIPGTYNSKFSILHSQLSSNIYFYQLKVGNFVMTKKMVLTK